jgi:pentatricopeptide repeat protein
MQPESAIPLMAQLARLRFRAGDEAGARAEAERALALFDAKRDTIANIYRARALRPIAEAYCAMGDTAAAFDLYKRAVEAGMENPNSRPRAEDLVATCCSLALHAMEPDAVLASRIREIQAGLGDPW